MPFTFNLKWLVHTLMRSLSAFPYHDVVTILSASVLRSLRALEVLTRIRDLPATRKLVLLSPLTRTRNRHELQDEPKVERHPGRRASRVHTCKLPRGGNHDADSQSILMPSV